MRFGKISAFFIAIPIATFVAMACLHPGRGSPLAILGGLLIMCSFPAALVLGILGIIFDRRKVLAIIATIIAAGFVLFCLFSIIMISIVSVQLVQ